MSLGIILDRSKLNHRCYPSTFEGIGVNFEDHCRLAANSYADSVGVLRELNLGAKVQLLGNAQRLRDEGEG